MRNVSDEIAFKKVEGLIDTYAIADCFNFSYRPIVAAVNFHFQCSDPIFNANDIEEPLPPPEQRVEWKQKVDL